MTYEVGVGFPVDSVGRALTSVVDKSYKRSEFSMKWLDRTLKYSGVKLSKIWNGCLMLKFANFVSEAWKRRHDG